MNQTLRMIGISLAVFISSLDTAIINTAIQPISASLSVSVDKAIWLVIIYHLALLSSMFFLGNLGEKKGYSKMMIIGIIIFVLSSLFCGLSESFLQLILSRFIQGLGASAILVSNVVLIKKSANSNNLGKLIGLNAMVIAAGFSLGPTIASLLLRFSSWSILFYINIPLGILALVSLFNNLPKDTINQSYNWKGNSLVAVLLLAFFLCIDLIYHQKYIFWSCMALSISIIGLLCTYFKQKKTSFDLLPIDLLENKFIRFSLTGTIVLFFNQSVGYVLFPLVLLQLFKVGITSVGFYISPWPLVATLIAPLSGYLSDKFSPSKISSLGLFFLTIGFLIISSLSYTIPTVVFGLVMMICGLGFGLFQSPNIKNIMTLAPQERNGMASSLLGFTRVFGQVLGSMFVSIFLQNYSIINWRYAVNVSVGLGVIGCVALLRSQYLVKKIT